jgi:hypothetical protein
MDSRREEWIARSVAALCIASRWLSCVSLVLAALTLGYLYLFPPASIAFAAMVSGAAAAGLIQAYLALRIEFDRKIFEALAAHPEGATAGTDAFDQAMHSLGMLPKGKIGRPLAERASGAVFLVRGAGWILVFQLALTLAVPWLP